MKIWVDADACPKVIKEILGKADSPSAGSEAQVRLYSGNQASNVNVRRAAPANQ